MDTSTQLDGEEKPPVVKLSEAAALLGLSPRAAESALRRAGIGSGYPREAVEQLAATHVRRTPRRGAGPTAHSTAPSTG